MHAQCSPSIYIWYCGKAAVIIAVCTAKYGYNGILNAHFLSISSSLSIWDVRPGDCIHAAVAV